MNKPALILGKFIKQHTGSSFPTEVETTGGERWLLKMAGSGNGVKSLLVEYLVNSLAKQAGLPVPAVSAIEIPQGFPWEFGTDEFDDLVQKSYGANLGIAMIAGAQPMREGEVHLQGEEFLKALVTLDSFFRNFDRTQSSLNILADDQGKAWITDHGSCLVLDATSAPNNLSLPPNHFLKELENRYFSLDLVNAIITDSALAKTLGGLPEAWLKLVGLSALDIEQLIIARRDLYLMNLMIRF